MRTGKEPIDYPRVVRCSAPSETIVAGVETFYFKLLTRPEIVPHSQFRRQNDLTLGGNSSLHESKIPSYSHPVKWLLAVQLWELPELKPPQDAFGWCAAWGGGILDQNSSRVFGTARELSSAAANQDV